VEASFLKTATEKRQYPDLQLPMIAFAGRSNVGKSSLINSLLKRRGLARTSSRPGHTQAINFYTVGERWLFVDLPGYGYARAPKQVKATWGPMIEEFLSSNPWLRLTILIVDARHEPTELDLIMRDFLLHYEVPFQVVATKSDKLSANRRQRSVAKAQQTLEVERILPYSSATGIGKRQLWQIIREV
jgi:GTP-binding protein